jgi:signal peptidase I
MTGSQPPISTPGSSAAAAAALLAAAEAGPAQGKKAPTMGPVRTNLEAFGAAIMAAVLLKWFCIEAYQIPTSSMQPTLMGDVSAQVFDRILVDKSLQTLREPQRWDITVFKYPLQQNQNYVKRLVGMPNDRLHIAGGNLYQVVDDDNGRRFEPIRKPADLQASMWKEVYPARRLVTGEAKALGLSWIGMPSSAVSETEQGFTLDLGSNSLRRLYFRDEKNGGFVDLYWDGYPLATAAAIREGSQVPPQEIVPDARIEAELTVEESLEELALEIEVRRPGLDKQTYALVCKDGQAKLQVRRKDTQVVLESAPFALPLPARQPVRLGLAHADDMLYASVDGEERQQLDTTAFACREGCVIERTPRTATADHAVTPQLVARGKGKLQVRNLQLWRDLHYTRDRAPNIIEVPAGHYYMMGDNTLGSIDSRGFTAVTIHTLDGRVVPADTPGAKPVRGNKRAMDLTRAPDRDETPIAIPREHAIVMIDQYGEVHRFEGDPGANWGKPEMDAPVVFRTPGTSGQDGKEEFYGETSNNVVGVSFVPRRDIQGRAMLVFYPCRPLSWLMGSNWPGRFGFVR